MSDDLTVWDLRNRFRGQRFGHANEAELEGGLAALLTGYGLPVQRQLRLDARSRIDLATELAGPVRLGIEVKVAGQAADVRRQVFKYTEHDTLDAVLLVTTIYTHLREIMPLTRPAPAGSTSPYLLGGKPFAVALINRGCL